MRAKELTGKATVFVVLALMLMTAQSPAAQVSPLGERDPTVVDPHLAEVLSTTDGDSVIEAIVQLEGEVLPEDLAVARSEGAEVLYQYTVVPALWLRAPARTLERLSGYDRVAWMEYNEQLQYMMDETTAVVNATRAWTSRIEGSLFGEGGITGEGVTVVVLDSGIDAGHPDLDYGTKTIRNLKSDTGTGPWYEVENGDTSSGHGTHVAGTVAGNGDASAGARAGVAPGANLIGLSAGEIIFISGGLGGLDWTYEHSRPGNNPYNIRVCTNSWGGAGGQYDPQDSISQAINSLVYENNVAVIFAAGNSGGSGDDIQASNYGNTPAAICVAASGRNGTYITDFSSKGQWNWVDTWPDVAAPGHNIESTAARRTAISVLDKGTGANPYYLAISGTSMATPHVAGTVALLWQAAPHLRVSEVRQDAGVVRVEDGRYVVMDPDDEGYGDLAYPYEQWMGDAPDTYVHEAELILKLTTTYIGPQGETLADMNDQTENYVPDWNVPGIAAERPHDFSQGYGLIDVHRAVGLALTLERIRMEYPEATVLDAYSVFEDVFERKEVSATTDRLATGWSAEWSRFTEGNILDPADVFSSNLTKYVYVPEGADEVRVTLSYSPLDTDRLTAGALGFRVDFDDDGTWDVTAAPTADLDGVVSRDIAVSGSGGQSWKVAVYGRGFRVQRPTHGLQYQEARVEVEVTVSITFPSGQGAILVNETDLHAINGHLSLQPSSSSYSAGSVAVTMDVYNLSRVVWSPPVEPPADYGADEGSLLWLVVLLVALLVAAYAVARLWPRSAPGRLVVRVVKATGLIVVYRGLKGGVVRVVHLLRPKGDEVVRAELVEE